MRIRLACLCSLVLAASSLAPASAQSVPKAGKEYEGPASLGFKIKMPDSWEFVPPQPGEQNEIGRFTGGDQARLVDYKQTPPHAVSLDVQLLKFDRRTKPGDPAPDPTKPSRFVIASFSDWLTKAQGEWKEQEKKDVLVNKVAAVRHHYLGEINSVGVRALAYEYKLSPDLEVVALFFGPAEEKKWGKFESLYDGLGKSFKAVTADATATGAGPKGTSARDVKRYELEQEVASQPGWALYETPNYFLISAKNDDKPFIEELKERLEAIRKVYEEVYPASLAAELKQHAKTKEAASSTPKPTGDGTTSAAAAPVDPMEQSRCSIVRICKDDEQYSSYGGPGGSAGYWSSYHKELVIYDDQKGGGRRNTWAVINHEAFHQYIYYFFGELAPHSWYNEGTGDFFSGYQLDRKKFVLKPFDWRQRLIQVNIGQEKFAPLKELVRWTQAQYYGNNDYKLGGGENYAQGWSFIYFLRTAKKSAKCWNPAWDSILDTYLRTLVETDDLDAAVDKAFAGVDWQQLESCWKDYTLHN